MIERARKSITELRRGNKKKGNTYIQVSEQKLYIVAIEKTQKHT